ncbi:helix-turn-helix domain-containing protein [Cellulophaga baltica]|uniref:helix-turn-helix domain-containing protein n=1 Tax=Cellulophaga TaxID=104264 RepID=UPI00190F4104|nr:MULTISPECIES: helix-turn-helix domain-containing protein [Cellulophaga]MCR1026657.1 helix-turn-helix domain-containing protein [Cellulophaga baltica]
MRSNKIKQSNTETLKIETQPISIIQIKDYLTVNETAKLLSISKRSVYRLIQTGKLKASNLSERLTRVKKSDINELLS